MLAALRFRGDERVLDHYKVEISLEEALRTRLSIGKLTRGSVKQYAKLAPAREGLSELARPENKARAEDYCWGREFVDLVTDYPGVVTEPQQYVPGAAAAGAEAVLDRVEPEAASG